MLFEENTSLEHDEYPWAQNFIDKMWHGFWTPNEFDFKSDYAQFKKEMPENEKQMVVKTLSAIGQVEIAVKRFWSQLGDKFSHPSLYDLGFVLANTEVIHSLAYRKLLDRLNLRRAMDENLKNPTLQGRVSYLRKYLNNPYQNDNRKRTVYALILFTLFVENVSLFSQFYVILHLNRFKNILKDTAQQVQYTKNEEALHAQVGIKLINTLRYEYPELFDDELSTRILEEVNAAIEAEDKIIEWMVGDYDEENLSAPILKAFIRKRINDSLHQSGFKFSVPVDKDAIEKTVWFDETLLGNEISDFFHTTPTAYSKKNKVYSDEDLF